MLQIVTEKAEYFDEQKQEFIYSKPRTLHLEHSLISISKWESKWEKPFLSNEKKTREENYYYISCMCLEKDVDWLTLASINQENLDKIAEYINKNMTATWFSDRQKRGTSQQVITSELIYYWMIANNIPFSCEKWHINRLLTLIRVCNSENNKDNNKLNRHDLAARNRALNKARKNKFKTRG